MPRSPVTPLLKQNARRAKSRMSGRGPRWRGKSASASGSDAATALVVCLSSPAPALTNIAQRFTTSPVSESRGSLISLASPRWRLSGDRSRAGLVSASVTGASRQRRCSADAKLSASLPSTLHFRGLQSQRPCFQRFSCQPLSQQFKREPVAVPAAVIAPALARSPMRRWSKDGAQESPNRFANNTRPLGDDRRSSRPTRPC